MFKQYSGVYKYQTQKNIFLNSSVHKIKYLLDFMY